MGFRLSYLYLRGGLGNQIFQWANLLNYNSKYVILDISTYSFGVGKNIELIIPELGLNIILIIRSRIISKVLRFVLTFFNFKTLFDDYYLDALNIIKHKNCLLRGYKLPREVPNLDFLLHIRGGDYLQFPYNSRYVSLNKDYYYWAIKKNLNKTIYVVSNDEEYSNLILNDISFNFIRGSDFFDDLSLLIKANSIVCANSTFSIVGALFSEANNVYYTKKYYYFEDFPISNIPKEWIIIEY